jgi:hypothetical protein
VTRSIHLSVSYDQPGRTRDAIGEAIDAGFRHVVLGLPAPYPAGVARWVTDELITTSADLTRIGPAEVEHHAGPGS